MSGTAHGREPSMVMQSSLPSRYNEVIIGQ